MKQRRSVHSNDLSTFATHQQPPKHWKHIFINAFGENCISAEEAKLHKFGGIEGSDGKIFDVEEWRAMSSAQIELRILKKFRDEHVSLRNKKIFVILTNILKSYHEDAGAQAQAQADAAKDYYEFECHLGADVALLNSKSRLDFVAGMSMPQLGADLGTIYGFVIQTSSGAQRIVSSSPNGDSFCSEDIEDIDSFCSALSYYKSKRPTSEVSDEMVGIALKSSGDGLSTVISYQIKLRKTSKIVTVQRCQFALDKTRDLVADITNGEPMQKIVEALKETQHFASAGSRGYALHAAVAKGNLQLTEGLFKGVPSRLRGTAVVLPNDGNDQPYAFNDFICDSSHKIFVPEFSSEKLHSESEPFRFYPGGWQITHFSGSPDSWFKSDDLGCERALDMLRTACQGASCAVRLSHSAKRNQTGPSAHHGEPYSIPLPCNYEFDAKDFKTNIDGAVTLSESGGNRLRVMWGDDAWRYMPMIQDQIIEIEIPSSSMRKDIQSARRDRNIPANSILHGFVQGPLHRLAREKQSPQNEKMARLFLKYGAHDLVHPDNSDDGLFDRTDKKYKQLFTFDKHGLTPNLPKQHWFALVYANHVAEQNQAKIISEFLPKISSAVLESGAERGSDAFEPGFVSDLFDQWPNVLHDLAQQANVDADDRDRSAMAMPELVSKHQRVYGHDPSSLTGEGFSYQTAFEILFSQSMVKYQDALEIVFAVDAHTNLPLLHTAVATCHDRSPLLRSMLGSVLSESVALGLSDEDSTGPHESLFLLNEPLVSDGPEGMLAPGATPLHALLSGVGTKLEPDLFKKWKNRRGGGSNNRLDDLFFHNPLLENMFNMVKVILDSASDHPEFDINHPDSNGNSPLHVAALASDLFGAHHDDFDLIIQLLLDSGADPMWR